MRHQGIKFSEDMTAELKLDEDETTVLKEEAEKVKAGLVSEGMEEEPTTEMAPEEPVMEESAEPVMESDAPVEAFSAENVEYSAF
jgi:hypothetical protein